MTPLSSGGCETGVDKRFRFVYAQIAVPEETFETPQTRPEALSKGQWSSRPGRPLDDGRNWSKIILVAVLGLSLLTSAAYAGYWYGTESAKVKTQSAKPVTVSQPTPKPMSTPTPIIGQENGVDLEDIKYKLPQGWEAKLGSDSLFISPVEGGGFLSIHVYDYPGDIGRREYYCQVSNVCIEGVSYFNEMGIGNISRYAAHALDNSGGGTEYFGAKGNKFYIISS